jgi:hypothetical protein
VFTIPLKSKIAFVFVVVEKLFGDCLSVANKLESITAFLYTLKINLNLNHDETSDDCFTTIGARGFQFIGINESCVVVPVSETVSCGGI